MHPICAERTTNSSFNNTIHLIILLPYRRVSSAVTTGPARLLFTQDPIVMAYNIINVRIVIVHNMSLSYIIFGPCAKLFYGPYGVCL